MSVIEDSQPHTGVDVVVALTDTLLADAVKGRGQLVPSLALAFPTPTGPSKGRGKLPPLARDKKSGRKVVSRENCLDAPESAKRLSRGGET